MWRTWITSCCGGSDRSSPPDVQAPRHQGRVSRRGTRHRGRPADALRAAWRWAASAIHTPARRVAKASTPERRRTGRRQKSTAIRSGRTVPATPIRGAMRSVADRHGGGRRIGRAAIGQGPRNATAPLPTRVRTDQTAPSPLTGVPRFSFSAQVVSGTTRSLSYPRMCVAKASEACP